MISFLKQYAERYSHVKGNIYTAEMPWKKGKSGGRFNTNADKIVFETQDDYVVFDKDEMLEYIRQKEMKEVKLDELLDKVDFKRLLPK